LKGRGYELAWLKNAWERFVLHVQGSGQIRLPDGKTLRVGFAASNGRPYRAIGRVLVERGFLPENELSLRRVKEFLQQNPERVEETFNANERYIFFRFFSGEEGPIGALGFPLTPGRSIATDRAISPPGGLAYLIAQQPLFDEAGRLKGKVTLRRFVLNQDTGAAMKGPGRVDLFCGSGEKAGMAAGEMREEGRIYFLQVKSSRGK
jgi:membrane-bound lytic murein transglycosylase A